jgi:hypothetical protein
MSDYIKQLEDQNEELRKMLAEEQRFSQATWHETYPNHFFFMSESIVYCEMTVTGQDDTGYEGHIKWNAWRAKDACYILNILAANTIEEAVKMAQEEVVRLIRSGTIIQTLDPRTFK